MGDAEGGSFDELLRRYRLAAGLTQEDLAERAGLSIRAISDLERGINRAPHRETVALLAGALNLPPAERAAFIGAVPRRVRNVRPAPPAPLPPLSPAPALPPLPPTPLVGRASELFALRALLNDVAARVVTLIGPPGVGKTHLALHLAHELAAQFPAGVLFVPLEALRNASEVLPAIAGALRLTDPGASPEALELALRSREMLLVLDNFEHVLAAGAAVARLVGAAPGLKVLVTSQARLRVRGEKTFQVRPLLCPDPALPLALDQLANYPAVQLFLARARESDPAFALTTAQAGAVAGICRRLDGLPLAIELAAARSVVLAPTALLPRLEKSLALLTSGPTDLPARQQTLRSALTWSYELLARAEQQLFRNLSAFAGGATLAAAGTVAAPDLSEIDLLNGLAALCEKSLLQRQPVEEGEERYIMLAVLHEFAAEHLAAHSGSAEEVRRRHATYYRDLAVSAASAMWVGSPERWLERLALEEANFRAALLWSLQADPAGIALPLAAALGEYWRVSGQWSEGRGWVERALRAAVGADGTVAYAAALQSAGELAFYQGDLAVAARHLHASMVSYAALPPDDGLPRATSTLAWVRLAQGAADDALDLSARGLELARQQGSAASRAWALHIRGHVARNSSASAEATAAFAESQVIWQALDHTRDSAWALLNLGEVARSQADFAQARLLYEAGRSRFGALDDPAGIVWAERNLGFVALAQSSAPAAAAFFVTSLRRYEQLGNRRGIAVSLVGQAGVAARLDLFEQAARLLGAASCLLDELGVQLDATDRRAQEQILAVLNQQIDAPAILAAQTVGRSWSLPEALAAAYAVGEG